MGFNTPFLVLNDALGIIKQNPEEFAEAVCRMAKSREPTVQSIGNHVNPVESVGAAHADQLRIIYSRGNTMTDLGNKANQLKSMKEGEIENLEQKAKTAKQEMDRLLEAIDECGHYSSEEG